MRASNSWHRSWHTCVIATVEAELRSSSVSVVYVERLRIVFLKAALFICTTSTSIYFQNPCLLHLNTVLGVCWRHARRLLLYLRHYSSLRRIIPGGNHQLSLQDIDGTCTMWSNAKRKRQRWAMILVMNTAFTFLSTNYSQILPMRVLLATVVGYSIDSEVLDCTLLSMVTVFR